MTEPDDHDAAAVAPGPEPALLEAVRAVIAPLARLAVARGLPYAAVDELLRSAFVEAAHAAATGLPEHRRVSRISAATGLNRREVTRLTQRQARSTTAPRSYPSELYARWTTAPEYLDPQRRPRPLPRLGQAPSFEALAQSVTRDMHPRSLLEAMLRLQLAAHDEATDTVTLTAEAFVPSRDRARMDAFLGDNVGDHLQAAVANVLGDGHRHFEQALYAGGLGEASIASLRSAIADHWRALTAALVPRLQQLVEQDADLPPAERRRLRIGLYEFHTPSEPADLADTPARARRAPGDPR